MTPRQIYKLVSARAEVPEKRAAYWLNDEKNGDSGDDYCLDCITSLPVLPGLVVCHLLALVGVDVAAHQQHDVDLEFCPTGYFVESELEHWEASGPPASGRGWWEVLEILDALTNYWMPDAETDQQWMAVGALLEKWGITKLDQRHIVGMTMGARKRRARHAAMFTGDDGPIDMSPAARRIFARRPRRSQGTIGLLMVAAGKDRYAAARASYRIGERLRPCPWCYGATDEMNCARVNWRGLEERPDGSIPKRWRSGIPGSPQTPNCDGSGVLPARPR